MFIKPILFNTDMVCAILDGRKAVTRRVIKPQPEPSQIYKIGYCTDGYKSDIGKFGFGTNEYGGKILYVKPPFRPGDILYVRETWQVYRTYPSVYGFDVAYRADQEIRPCIFSLERYERFVKYENSKNYPRWISSQFMPKEAARIWIKVTDVRVERLQDMSYFDYLKEGINVETKGFGVQDIANQKYRKTWDSTIKKPDIDRYGWSANPWVWVVEFERCEKPVPCILAGVQPAEDKHPCIGYGKSEIDDEPCEMCKHCSECTGN